MKSNSATTLPVIYTPQQQGHNPPDMGWRYVSISVTGPTSTNFLPLPPFFRDRRRCIVRFYPSCAKLRKVSPQEEERKTQRKRHASSSASSAVRNSLADVQEGHARTDLTGFA